MSHGCGDRAAGRGLEEIFQNQRLKVFHALKDGVVCNQSCSLGVYSGRCLKGVGSSQAMLSANSGGQIGKLQIRGNPREVRMRGKQSVEVICSLLVAFAVGKYQQFGHRNRGRDRFGFRPFKPRKDKIGVREIFWVEFQVINEDTRVQSDSAVTPEKGAEPLYSQL